MNRGEDKERRGEGRKKKITERNGRGCVLGSLQRGGRRRGEEGRGGDYVRA